jgi:hypothetical protein
MRGLPDFGPQPGSSLCESPRTENVPARPQRLNLRRCRETRLTRDAIHPRGGTGERTSQVYFIESLHRSAR